MHIYIYPTRNVDRKVKVTLSSRASFFILFSSPRERIEPQKSKTKTTKSGSNQ